MRSDTGRATFLPMLYREFLLLRKNIISNCLIVIISYAICLMFSLSAVYGNIAKSDNDICIALKGAIPATRLMGIILSFMLFLAAGDISAEVNSNAWRHFRLSAPVKPLKMALAKYTMMFLALTASIIVALLYNAADRKIYQEFSNYYYYGLVFAIGAGLSVFTVMNVSMTFLCGSADKGGLLSSIGSLIMVMPFMIQKIRTMEDRELDPFEMIESVSSFCNKNVLWFVLIIVLVFIIGLLVQTWCYKRRDT